jgi:hypothetical protein
MQGCRFVGHGLIECMGHISSLIDKEYKAGTGSKYRPSVQMKADSWVITAENNERPSLRRFQIIKIQKQNGPRKALKWMYLRCSNLHQQTLKIQI